jgi:hypothetical protein
LEGKPYGIKLRWYEERLGNNLQTWGTLWERDGNKLETSQKKKHNKTLPANDSAGPLLSLLLLLLLLLLYLFIF